MTHFPSCSSAFKHFSKKIFFSFFTAIHFSSNYCYFLPFSLPSISSLLPFFLSFFCSSDLHISPEPPNRTPKRPSPQQSTRASEEPKLATYFNNHFSWRSLSFHSLRLALCLPFSRGSRNSPLRYVTMKGSKNHFPPKYSEEKKGIEKPEKMRKKYQNLKMKNYTLAFRHTYSLARD